MITEALPVNDVSATTPARHACAHCGLPVPAGLVQSGVAHQFCCEGCRTAREIITGCGLDAFYALRAGSETADQRSAVTLTSRRFAEFDDAAFRTLYVRPLPEGLATAEVCVPAAHCTACVWLLERLPRLVPGALEARLDLRRATVRLTWDETKTRLSAIAQAMATLGYTPYPARGAAARAAIRAEDRRHLVRLAIAGACAGNVMLLALALYAGLFSEIDPAIGTFFRWLSMAISTVSVLGPGGVFFRSAWAALRTRTIQLDVPIAIGLAAGLVWGVVNTIRGTGEIYFDSLSVLVFALLAGRWIQHRQQRRTADSLELLFSLTPTSARRVEGNDVCEVPIEALRQGDVVEVRAGDSFPGDGVIVQGRTSVDQSLLTGESRPIAVGEGECVYAGATNISGLIRMRIDAAGAATRLGKLMRLVEESATRRAPIVRFADRIAGWFVVGMLTLAGITFVAQLPRGLETALDHTVALLIVTCPCALGLATPLAMTAAIGRAARRGMLVKGGEAIERLANPGLIFLDKTGTLTEGRMALVEWCGDESVKPLVAALESASTHPVARALVRDIPTTATLAPADIVATVGAGIEGVVAGRHIKVGSPHFVTGGFEAPAWFHATVADAVTQALTPVGVAVDGRPVAVAMLGDRLRPDAADAIAALKSAGWRIGMLSGDHETIAACIGRRLGLDPSLVRGSVSPEAKLAAVEAAAKEGPVVMVGDGVNDAAALAAATVGIAVKGGAETSLAAADVYLNTPGLMPIVELVGAARRTLHVIHLNLAASLFYNALAATLAITGVINPLIAAILMPLSSLTVVTISFRMPTFPTRRAAQQEANTPTHTMESSPCP
jgi:P-type Cu2+ transporter